MRLHQIIGLSLMVVGSLKANIGENMPQIEARYGKPVTKLADNWVYEKEGVKISVYFDKLPPVEVHATLNAGGPVDKGRPALKSQMQSYRASSTNAIPGQSMTSTSTKPFDPSKSISTREMYQLPDGSISDKIPAVLQK